MSSWYQPSLMPRGFPPTYSNDCVHTTASKQFSEMGVGAMGIIYVISEQSVKGFITACNTVAQRRAFCKILQSNNTTAVSLSPPLHVPGRRFTSVTASSSETNSVISAKHTVSWLAVTAVS